MAIHFNYYIICLQKYTFKIWGTLLFHKGRFPRSSHLLRKAETPQHSHWALNYSQLKCWMAESNVFFTVDLFLFSLFMCPLRQPLYMEKKNVPHTLREEDVMGITTLHEFIFAELNSQTTLQQHDRSKITKSPVDLWA